MRRPPKVPLAACPRRHDLSRCRSTFAACLQGRDSNPQPRANEPGEVPFLYPAIYSKRAPCKTHDALKRSPFPDILFLERHAGLEPESTAIACYVSCKAADMSIISQQLPAQQPCVTMQSPAKPFASTFEHAKLVICVIKRPPGIEPG